MTPRKPLADEANNAADDPLDLITPDEIPEYQADLQQLVTAIQQEPEMAQLIDGIGYAAVKLAFVVVNPRVKRTVSEYCRVAGVDRGVYYRAVQNPKWVAFKNTLGKQFTEHIYTDAIVSLQQLIRMGDVKAIRLFFELRGDLVQRTESTVVKETTEDRMKRIRAQQSLRDAAPVPEAPAAAPGSEDQADTSVAPASDSHQEASIEQRLARARQRLDGKGD